MVQLHLSQQGDITASLVSNLHSDDVNTLSSIPRSGRYQFETDGPGLISPRGYRHDNDREHIHDIKILPTADECLCTTRAPWMPEKNVSAAHCLPLGCSRHVDIHFRMLRHDATEKIRDINYKAAQESFLSTNTADELNELDYLETPAGNRFFLYHNLKVEDVVPDEFEGLMLRMSFDCPKHLQKDGLSKSNRFSRGMLCAVLCLDHTTNKLSVYYFNIHRRQTSYALVSRYGKHNRAAVQLALLPDSNELEIRDAMSIATGGWKNVSLALVEYPKLLYAGFSNALHRLQEMSDDSYSFSHYISPALEIYHNHSAQLIPVQLPSYSRRSDFAFDLQPLTGRSDSLFTLRDLCTDKLAETLLHLAHHTTLDAGQARALLCSLTRELAFTQGPPGCGKTYLGIALARVLLASRPAESKRPILVVCRTNHALDSFLAGLRDAGVTDLLRVGRASREEWTDAINLYKLTGKKLKGCAVKYELRSLEKEQNTNYGHLEAWCKGLSKEGLNKFPC